MYKKLFTGLASFLFVAQVIFAGSVDTVSIYSQSMNKTTRAVVIKPASYDKEKEFPVVYLLHGHSGNYSNWIKRVPDLKTYADVYRVLIVCPDGAYSSWYFDSPVKNDMRYETYVAQEVPAFIDDNFKTIKDRRGRVITGLSMGGHGALFIGYRHADKFSGCGSMSGAVDLESIRGGAGVAEVLGDTLVNKKFHREYSVLNVVHSYPKDSLAIIIDCGVDDFLYKSNRELHSKLLELKTPHDYIERPGKHDWTYWRNAVAYQLLFFRKVFDKNGMGERED